MAKQTDRDRRFARAEAALGEYFTRVASGESVSIEQLAAEHPEIAAELRDLHSMCDALRSRARPSAAAAEPAGDLDAAEALAQLQRAANRHGEYEIDPSPIAEGGMGVVYAARDRALGRDIALKVLRERRGSPRSSSRRVLRFLDEARVTSQLDHPGIVPVHEIGVDAAGRPYFSMKRVRGQTFASVLERVAARDERWPQTRALDVLQRACEAVAFAHEHGVIHRDLKPSNVMVGDFGEVYVMDWGLARVLASPDERAEASGDAARDASDGVLANSGSCTTQDGEVIGTPAYMAPEQALGKRDEVGRHSDVYSAGAMLYQLLAGRPPHADAEGLPPARTVLARVEAGAPEPLSRIAASAPAELIAICEKAMERDGRRRYADMSAFADDLAAFLHGRVVRAHETGAWAQTRKWVGRNRALAAALAGAIVFLAAGAVTSMVYASEARGQAAIARSNAAEAERNARAADANAATAQQNEVAAKQSEAEARASERRAKRVTEFVQTALVKSDPNQGGARQYLVTDAMERAIDELGAGALGDDPQTEATLQATIARILQGNGRPEEALHLAETALETRRQLFGDEHADVANSTNDVACCLQTLGRSAEALPLLDRALDINQRLHAGDHRDVATCMNNVALCLDTLGRSSEALRMHEQALEMRRRLFPGDQEDVAQSLNNLGLCLGTRGQMPAALAQFEAALAMNQRLHPGDHPTVVNGLNNVGACLERLGRSAEALPLFETAAQMGQRLYVGDHSAVAASLSGVASALGSAGRREEALVQHERVLAMRQRLFDGDHPEIAVSLNNVAACLDGLGRSAQALPSFEAALAMNQRLHAGDHPHVASSLSALGTCLEGLGRTAEALERHRVALDMRLRLFPGDQLEVATELERVAACREALGEREEALAGYRLALAMYERLFPSGHAYSAMCLFNVARCLVALDQTVEALSCAERANAIVVAGYPDGHPARRKCADELGRIRRAAANTAGG